ncbi:MAG: cytochrome c3 family protein, partial [bacterium]|nr:cytochrome c3 family protein [bacterium]
MRKSMGKIMRNIYRMHRIFSVFLVILSFFSLGILHRSSVGKETARTSQKVKPCYQCHTELKQKYNQKYIHAPVKKSDCEACHERHGFANNLVLKQQGAALCYSCHSQIVQGEHITVTPSSCYLCHFKGVEKGKSFTRCLGCHKPPLKVVEFQGVTFDHQVAIDKKIQCEKCHLDVVLGDGAVVKDRCYSCHNEPWKIEKYRDTDLMHKNHVTDHKVDCLRCHDAIQHKVTKMAEAIEINCSACHPNYHAAQRELYMGIGGKGKHQNILDPMFLARVSCLGCHISPHGDEVKGYTQLATNSACVHCHTPQTATMVPGWKQKSNQAIEQMEAIIAQAKKEINQSRSTAAKQLVADAEYNIRLINYGGAVHNIRYSIELIQASYNYVQQALRLVKSTYIPPALQLKSLNTKSDCYQCHLGIEQVNKPIFGVTFKHQNHLELAKLDCIVCHRNTEKKHGAMIMTRAKCMQCHHTQQEYKCQVCHAS